MIEPTMKLTAAGTLTTRRSVTFDSTSAPGRPRDGGFDPVLSRMTSLLLTVATVGSRCTVG